MGIAGDHVHYGNLLSADLIVYHRIRLSILICAQFPQLDQSVAGNNHKLFVFGVVPVLAFGNTRFADIYRNLSSVRRPEDFRKTSSVILIHLQGIGKSICRKVGQVSAVKNLCKSIAHIRYGKVLPAFFKFMEKIHDTSQSSLIGERAIAMSLFVSVFFPI